jgi:dienelactone hydrolase
MGNITLWENVMKKITYFLIITILISGCTNEKKISKRDQLLQTIGLPERPKDLKLNTIETVELTDGIRYKVEYTVSDYDTIFDFPEKRVRAYLFVPKHQKGEKLPAIIALHQYGMTKKEWGKMEPAGLAGDPSQFYGLELYKRGYIVIIPDRPGFGERAKLSERAEQYKDWLDSMSCDPNKTKEMGDVFESEASYPILTLKGITPTGMDTSEFMVAVDVLLTVDCIDKSSIGAIGHSGGGIALIPLMLADTRIKAGISSCGFENIEKKYHRDSDMFWDSGSPIFGLLKVGTSLDIRSVNEFVDMIEYAKKEYAKYGASDKIQMNVFEENNGLHSFPEKVKSEAYEWLDRQLKAK